MLLIFTLTKIYNDFFKKKIEATRLQQCIEIEVLEFENQKVTFLKKANEQKLCQK